MFISYWQQYSNSFLDSWILGPSINVEEPFILMGSIHYSLGILGRHRKCPLSTTAITITEQCDYPPDLACWCSLIRGLAWGGPLDTHPRFQPLFPTLPPSWMAFSPTACELGLMCIEHRVVTKGETMQLWGSRHLCWDETLWRYSCSEVTIVP